MNILLIPTEKMCNAKNGRNSGPLYIVKITRFLRQIFQSLCANKLYINLSKNQFHVFNNTKKSFIPNFHIDKHLIEITDFVRFLEYSLAVTCHGAHYV